MNHSNMCSTLKFGSCTGKTTDIHTLPETKPFITLGEQDRTLAKTGLVEVKSHLGNWTEE